MKKNERQNKAQKYQHKNEKESKKLVNHYFLDLIKSILTTCV